MSTLLTSWPGNAASAAGRAAADAPWAGVGAELAASFGHPLVLVIDEPLDGDDEDRVLDLARTGPVLLAGPTLTALNADGLLAAAAGVQTLGRTPTHEIRTRLSAGVDPRAVGTLLVRDSYPLVDKVADDVVVLATANVAYTDHAVLTWRPSSGVGVLTLGSESATWSDPRFAELVRRWADVATGRPQPAPLRVGILGYGAIGHEHARAFLDVPGYELAGVCDQSAARVDAARELAPGLESFADGAALLASTSIDLVVVSTPPDTHAAWAMAALSAGKHVLLEKPMALSTAECDAVLARAAEVGRTAVVYQNRRWDADYLVLQRIVRSGAIGSVFHLESFVGGYGHPCNYWHSDAAVSGGAIFDWGSHYLDQILDLLPRSVASVTANNHKRVWHDVTNADHARVTLRFDDGTEAEFTHSDIAAAMKPKWYVLGTEGAVVGHWRTERVVSRSSIGTMTEDILAPADSPALMTLHAADGSVTQLAVPPAPPHAFHRELANHLLDGMPMTIEPRRSRDVVAVMEAAETSARAGGRPVVPE